MLRYIRGGLPLLSAWCAVLSPNTPCFHAGRTGTSCPCHVRESTCEKKAREEKRSKVGQVGTLVEVGRRHSFSSLSLHCSPLCFMVGQVAAGS